MSSPTRSSVQSLQAAHSSFGKHQRRCCVYLIISANLIALYSSIMTCRLVLSLRTQVDVHGNAATGSSSRSRMTNNFMMSDKRPETSVVAMPRIDDAFANDDSSFDLEGQKEPTRVK